MTNMVCGKDKESVLLAIKLAVDKTVGAWICDVEPRDLDFDSRVRLSKLSGKSLSPEWGFSDFFRVSLLTNPNAWNQIEIHKI